MTDIRIWRLDPERVEEWRDIRLISLRDAPEAFDVTLTEWLDRPLADFEARLRATPVFAAGREIGYPLAVASWQAGLDPRDDARGWLLSIFARREVRGQGFAEAAIREVIRDAAGSGMSSLGLNVLTANLSARALYRRMGFVETEREGVTNRHGVPETEMILPQLPRTR